MRRKPSLVAAVAALAVAPAPAPAATRALALAPAGITPGVAEPQAGMLTHLRMR